MTDLRDDLDRMIGAFDYLSLLADFKTRVGNVQKLTVPRCGSCKDWMKSKICPRERNVNGWNKGPHMNDTPCDQFQWKPSSLELIGRQIEDLVVFAEINDLPAPEHLRLAIELANKEP